MAKRSRLTYYAAPPDERRTNEETDTDIGIIGGGPAGASMAAYLAKAGVKCVVFESEMDAHADGPNLRFEERVQPRVDQIYTYHVVYYSDEPEVLTKMRRMVSTVEENPAHPWHELLNNLTPTPSGRRSEAMRYCFAYSA